VKISDSKSIPQPVDKQVGKPAARNGAAVAPASGEPIQLSPMSSQLSALETQLAASPAFDSAKVESIKAAIRDGQFTINSGAIADKLLAGVQEFLKAPH
jgi:negative regulator of flagellin synthesis FlgM